MGDRRTDVVVDFFVPGASAQERGAYLAAYTDLYERLYDEDVWMMTVRQTHLDVRRSTSRAGDDLIDLGPLEVVCAQLPLRLESRGREYRVVEVSGVLIAHAVVCPHLLGPLGDADVLDGVVQCPWHGYRFDVRSGANCSGQRCRLPAAPKLHVDTASQHVFAAWG
jgi:nitrite reductase/ring-hydroxylating ferredoxin subunit